MRSASLRKPPAKWGSAVANARKRILPLTASYLSTKLFIARSSISGRVGILPAGRGILPRGLSLSLGVHSGETPEPAGGTPTLPESRSDRPGKNLAYFTVDPKRNAPVFVVFRDAAIDYYVRDAAFRGH